MTGLRRPLAIGRTTMVKRATILLSVATLVAAAFALGPAAGAPQIPVQASVSADLAQRLPELERAIEAKRRELGVPNQVPSRNGPVPVSGLRGDPYPL